jgi:hypothetical protein
MSDPVAEQAAKAITSTVLPGQVDLDQLGEIERADRLQRHCPALGGVRHLLDSGYTAVALDRERKPVAELHSLGEALDYFNQPARWHFGVGLRTGKQRNGLTLIGIEIGWFAAWEGWLDSNAVEVKRLADNPSHPVEYRSRAYVGEALTLRWSRSAGGPTARLYTWAGQPDEAMLKKLHYNTDGADQGGWVAYFATDTRGQWKRHSLSDDCAVLGSGEILPFGVQPVSDYESGLMLTGSLAMAEGHPAPSWFVDKLLG